MSGLGRSSPFLAVVVLTACDGEYFLRGRDEPVEPAVYATERFEQVALPKVDILWVVDDTGSMIEEQAALAASFGSFVDAVDAAGLAYQIGVITTEGTGPIAGVLQGDPWIITPACQDSAGAFASAVSVGTEGGGEAGLGALALALSEPLRSEENLGFRREDAALHVIVVSDDDDHSTGVLGTDPATFILNFLQAESNRTGLPAVLSAVVGDTPNGCRGPGGSAAAGTLYAEVAEASGGVVESICAADLSDVAAEIGQSSIHYPQSFPLQVSPYLGEVRVSVGGVRTDSGWTLTDEPAITFDEPPAPGVIVEVIYRLPPGESS